MKVTLAVLADYANTTREGKLNIMGIFGRIWAGTFPAKHPVARLVITLEADITDSRRTKKLEVQLRDEDGHNLFHLGADISPGEIAPGKPWSSNQILEFQNLTFEKPGSYTFDIYLDNNCVRQVPLEVTKLPDQPNES